MKFRPAYKIILKILLSITIISIVIPEAYAQFPDRELNWKNLNVDGNASTVYVIFRDNEGILWLGTDQGLYFYDGFSTHSVGFREIGDFHVYALTQEGERLYIGTNNGLFYFDYNTGKIEQENPALPGEIRSLLIVGDEIWIGSLNGLFSYNISNQEMKDHTAGLPGKSVYSILKDSRGILYAGTYSGLARWDSIDNVFHTVAPENKNFTGFFINSMIESDDKKSLYLGGENNLYKYTPALEAFREM